MFLIYKGWAQMLMLVFRQDVRHAPDQYVVISLQQAYRGRFMACYMYLVTGKMKSSFCSLSLFFSLIPKLVWWIPASLLNENVRTRTCELCFCIFRLSSLVSVGFCLMLWIEVGYSYHCLVNHLTIIGILSFVYVIVWWIIQMKKMSNILAV